MKLKEAQMLGILAVIAVGIILLCMWGSSDEVPQEQMEATGESAVFDPYLEPGIAELCEHLQETVQPEPAPEPAWEEFTMTVSGDAAPAPARTTEEDAIWTRIEETDPADIRLMQPPEPEPEQEPAETEPAAPAPRPAAPTPRTIVHVVQRGDTLSSISKEYYGSTTKWQLIQEANGEAVPDPRRLAVNTRLVIPPLSAVQSEASPSRPRLSATADASAAPARTYTVKKGDKLYRIAVQYYGDGNRWRDILRANRHQLSRPEELRPGMKLTIP